MRGLTAAAIVVAAAIPASGATARVRPSTAGAKPVQLTLTLQAELQCGHLRSGSVTVVLPPGFSVPQRIDVAAVRIGGRAPAALSVSRSTHTVQIAPQRPQGIVCNSIAPGSVGIVFARAANLGNPARPGRYRISLTAGSRKSVASLTIR